MPLRPFRRRPSRFPRRPCRPAHLLCCATCHNPKQPPPRGSMKPRPDQVLYAYWDLPSVLAQQARAQGSTPRVWCRFSAEYAQPPTAVRVGVGSAPPCEPGPRALEPSSATMSRRLTAPFLSPGASDTVAWSNPNNNSLPYQIVRPDHGRIRDCPCPDRLLPVRAADRGAGSHENQGPLR